MNLIVSKIYYQIPTCTCHGFKDFKYDKVVLPYTPFSTFLRYIFLRHFIVTPQLMCGKRKIVVLHSLPRAFRLSRSLTLIQGRHISYRPNAAGFPSAFLSLDTVAVLFKTSNDVDHLCLIF